MKKILFSALIGLFTLPILAQNTPPQYPKVAQLPPMRWGADKVAQKFPYDIILRDTAQNLYKSSDVLKTEGKPLVLMFWLTTCGPCRMELEAIKQNYEAWQKETPFRMIAMSTDFTDNFKSFIERVKVSGWQFEAYNDANREFMWAMPGGLNGLPQVFVLDGNGNITYHHRRFIPGDEKELFAEIQKAAKGIKN
jgi:cytochrome c biogenesis protein CcmG, thiol:disulfide interchange protein DsbE